MKTVTENWVPMWVKNPSRVPGRSHTVRTPRRTSAGSVTGSSTTVPGGVLRTSATVSISDSTPNAETAANACVQPGPVSSPRNGTADRTWPNWPEIPVS